MAGQKQCSLFINYNGFTMGETVLFYEIAVWEVLILFQVCVVCLQMFCYFIIYFNSLSV